MVACSTFLKARKTKKTQWGVLRNRVISLLKVADFLVDSKSLLARPRQGNERPSLAGNTIPEAGTPGQANCHGQIVSAMANEFGGIDASASTLGYSSVDALQDGIRVFCKP